MRDGALKTDHSVELPEATAEELEIIPTEILSPIALSEIFRNRRPIEVDLGSGPGKFIVEAAQMFPDRNFLGVERLLGRVRKTRIRAFRLGVHNLRLLRMEIEYAVRYLLPKESISRFHLSFPDPWPKRRHHRRRIVDRDFLDALWGALITDGEIRIKTDHQAYFQQILRTAGESQRWNLLDWGDEAYPMTDFEQDFMAKKLPIYRLRAVRRNSVPLKV
jgi:tRNA (guanine-N7-)-methyltransferase